MLIFPICDRLLPPINQQQNRGTGDRRNCSDAISTTVTTDWFSACSWAFAVGLIHSLV